MGQNKWLHSDKFSLPIDHTQQYTGYHDPETHWNGWACPYFEKDECLRVLNADWIKQSDDFAWEYDAEQDKFIVLFRVDERDEIEIYEAQTITLLGGETRTVYALGAWSWCWAEEAVPPNSLRVTNLALLKA